MNNLFSVTYRDRMTSTRFSGFVTDKDADNLIYGSKYVIESMAGPIDTDKEPMVKVITEE